MFDPASTPCPIRFHGMDDAKEIWDAIRTRFGGNANSKKMQKAVLKQQFEAFTISSSEGLEKGYEDLDLLHEDLEQIDDIDIEEMDINWHIAMIAIRMKKEFPSKGTNDGKKRDSFYQDQGAGKKEQNQNCLLTMDDGVVNLGAIH
ncbi:hypothetical protein Tco_0729287 [Tanacetum coccineum]|uniref:Uncharacterized protein n=1 Tax=Tanacetum coccineum TaxID=301880 RepID=A0ABQ4YPR8_9ASTR